MKLNFAIFWIATILLSCTKVEPIIKTQPLKYFNLTYDESIPDYKYLALGDSYTIGQSVCQTCSFPMQMKDSLEIKFNNQIRIETQIIAQTGWTTSNLINYVNAQQPSNDFDLVTLLIGVNNQYQNLNFSVFEEEFPQLVALAIEKAGNDKNKVLVVSIPDYMYTPFGDGTVNFEAISAEIENYNNFIENYCTKNEIEFEYITDITQQGLSNPDLVASDGLHPSSVAYALFVERMLPNVVSILGL